MASLEPLLVAGIHFSIGCDVYRPRVAAVAGEIDSADPAINVASGGPSVFRGDEYEFTDRPRTIQRPRAPRLSAVGRDVNPPFDIRSNLAAADPPNAVIPEKYRPIKHRVNRRPALPLRSPVRTAAEVNAGGSGMQVRQQTKLEAEPSLARICGGRGPVRRDRSAIGGVLHSAVA